MIYSRAFFSDRSVVQDLLDEGGVQLEPLRAVISQIGRLCAISQIIDKMAQDHVAGDLLPLRFEIELTLPPISILRSETVDVMKEFEDSSVLVSLGGGRYRVMLSVLMNTLFGLSSSKGEDSIEQTISRFNNPEPFKKALESVQWEIIRSVHEHIDLKYLALDSLEQTLPPSNLVEVGNASKSILERIAASEGFGEDLEFEMTRAARKLRTDSGLLEVMKEYIVSLSVVSAAVKREANRQWDIMRDIVSYPRSFLARKKEPLVKSSWSLSPDFRSHPLIVKYQELIAENHSTLARLADVYEDHIADAVETIGAFPKCLDLHVALMRRFPDLPSEQDFKSTWDQIDTQCRALLVQANLIESVVSSMDSLFAYQKQ
ncbi:MAG: hypothetical protein JSW61_10075 [Candidatus Thorarchaeota archaeon]|nr:MAG: hypothetical protein JSW61_10075 [Candidatus Thorarchaeota archaeon]